MSLDPDKIAAELSPAGFLARHLQGYENRPEQVNMARAVARTFADGGVLAVEAGTGTGKSLAYLVPAIHWSRENGERVIVSTRTINLQEQLVKKDLPFLAERLGVAFRAALVKGRGNYLCLRKAAELRAEPALAIEDASRGEIEAILAWGSETRDGSLAELDFVPRPEAWGLVAAEHDDCLRARCPDYENCFFYKARREAAAADLLVVNHHLLMADTLLRAVLPDEEQSGVLPKATRVILDEAHHLEDVATDYFGSEVTARRIERILSRLQNPRTPTRGVLPALATLLREIRSPEDRPAAEGAMRWIEERLRRRAPELAAEAVRCFDSVLLELQAELRESSGAAALQEAQHLRLLPDFRETSLWKSTRSRVSSLAESLESFASEIRPVLERLASFSESSAERTLFLFTQLQALAGRIAAAATDLRVFTEETPDLCRWLDFRFPGDAPSRLSLCSAPIAVGPRLRDSLFERFETSILTSATLTVEGRFDYFFKRNGIASLPSDRVRSLRLPSPFHFSEQALIAVPADLPEPDAAGHESALHDAVARLVEASGGGAFVLFTSYAALLRAHAALEPLLCEKGLKVLRQGELGRHVLLDRFRRNSSSVLFATDSFWEGVDVRGRGLRLVVIAKLPFRVPTEPIQQARVEAIESQGGNAFADFALPQAVIKLRQGFGRLIRSHDDCGVVALLDSRIARRRYGEVFLNSLPHARLVMGSSESVFAEVEKFLRRC